MFRFICITLCVICSNTYADWNLYVHVGGKGGDSIVTEKCYIKNDILNSIPLSDSEPNFKWANDNNKSFRSEMFEVGSINGTKLFDIHQHIDEGYYDYIKLSLFENNDGLYCPFYILLGRDSNIQLSNSNILKVDESSLFVNKARHSGNGGYYLENYYVFDNGVVQEVDVDTSINATVNEILSNHPELSYGPRSDKLDLERMVYNVQLYKKDDCSACSSGKIELGLSFSNNTILVESKSIEVK